MSSTMVVNCVLLFLAVFLPSGLTETMESKILGYDLKEVSHYATNHVAHRKLLYIVASKRTVDNSDRFWGDITECPDSAIQINQGPGAPLPSGIPTYTVTITNACASGCDVTDIHVRCGWFTSARLIDPKIFKRLKHDDCLVNYGKPLQNGQAISFQYADTRSKPLIVTSMKCL